jgi:hypothetical protein
MYYPLISNNPFDFIHLELENSSLNPHWIGPPEPVKAFYFYETGNGLAGVTGLISQGGKGGHEQRRWFNNAIQVRS